MIGRPPKSPLFPYTTLFRSVVTVKLQAPASSAVVVPTTLPFRATATVLPGWAVPLSVGTTAKVAPSDGEDRKSTRLNSSHANISYAVFCLKKKKKKRRACDV